MSQQQASTAFFEAMFESKILGLCTFETNGRVLTNAGAADAWAPSAGHLIDEAPVFVGLIEAIQNVRISNKPLSIAGVSLDGQETSAIDIDIIWLESQSCFAAMSKSAVDRVSHHKSYAQAIRDNRLLEEKIKDQQAKISEQAEMMRIFVQHVPAAVAMLNTDLDILMTSQRWIQEHGDPKVASPVLESASPLTWPRVREELRLALEGGVPTVRTVKTIRRGRTDWKRLAQAPWRRADYEIGGTILFSEDVTEAMRKAENLRARIDDLHKLGAELDQLGEAVTNDLRAPMRQIDFFSRFLLDNELSRIDPASRDYLHQIRACAERIDKMMSALQRYLSLSGRELYATPFDIGDAVTASSTSLRPKYEQAGMTIFMRNSMTVSADFELISCMFEKLLENCLKYAGEGASVIIDCLDEPDGVLIQITDDGPGIPAHRRRRAFDFFERLDAPVTIPGEGMGLAECSKIINLHGGGMTLDPDFDGGLRVLISLPVQTRKKIPASPRV